MEHNLKKKTKQLITLKTNNFIDSDFDKQRFFSHLLQALQTQLTPQQFTFLTTYLLFHQSNSHKKNNHQIKTPTQKRIVTLPQQRPFNPCDIDPDLFQDKPIKQQNFVLKKSTTNLQQIDRNCTNTPKKKTKLLIFQNKRIMDLDKKLKLKYQANKNLIVYNPKIMEPDKQNQSNDRYFTKTLYQNSLKKTNGKQHARRLKTSFTNTRKQKLKTQPSSSEMQNHFFTRTPKSCLRSESTPTERLRDSQNSIPKHLLEQVILSRRYNKIDRSCNDFSDYKLSSRYKNCFS